MRIVIIGAGFAGLACAKALGDSSHDVLVIDRRNYNLFQPLLYQVATAALSPGDIAEPIRKIVKRFRNISVVMAEVTGFDLGHRQVLCADDNNHAFEVLIVATGSVYSYFGNDDWKDAAPGLKTVEQALAHRNRLLSAFERAEKSEDEAQQRQLMTSVIIGGGPTGVEMAGAIAELGRWTLEGEFRNVDPRRARVLLIEGGDTILGQFPKPLVDYSMQALAGLGVEVMLNTKVTDIRADGVEVGDRFIPAGTVIWGAGVTASPATKWLGVDTDKNGRVRVDGNLAVVGLTNVYALGDIALFLQDDQPLPGLAQVAKQQGEYLGKILRKKGAAKQFRFHNRGNTAVIGRHAAIFDFGRFQLKGPVAWMLWALVHVYLLVSFEKRALVSLQWLWRYISKARGVRLIP